ncbi:ABC transporter ATP-binding protein [Roseomonas marmotae]|uniref:ABC transporter ATP-binding protein n=1 Tax=Roseomonas marmotae TaxID=2768161 RepID=A0ABS3KDC1_9PROT|nr:ABC transporter ATP-binding protein [Roseomonas marmotae]MBO1074643.1 ABC transporter ATP-binding protein [Roseomonas marmotae]QTI81663.1 ABC transporter ATP-binding protein [Roseomonas marmotae]
MLLEVRDLDVRYGRTHAVAAASLAVAEGEVVAVLGANGAGKSSLLKAILGTVTPAGGGIRFDGADITTAPVPRRIRDGLVLVPEGRRILVSMTIQENLLLGAGLRRDRATIPREIDAIYDRFPNLAARRDMPAAVLSGGEQQMLAIGRAMLARPRLMMLDEPSLGLSPLLVDRVFALLRELNADGMSLLLVEQNTRKTLELASRGYVLELGRIVMADSATSLLADEGLQRAYLGAG